MQRILKNVKIVDKHSVSEVQDILINQDKIAHIGTDIVAPDAEVWDAKGALVSTGWLDLGVHVADPGFEHREDLQSAARAAAAGGFTAIACFPNTHPAIHSKSEVLYIKNNTAQLPVRFYPIGAISIGTEGKDLAELMDMHHAGAVAFSDGSHAVQDAGLLLRAMQYAKAFNGLILNEPHHKTIAGGGQMHEGLTSTMLGLKGLPTLSESVMIQRDLSLLEYAESRLHIHLVSTRKGVEMIRTAKKAGAQVTASVAIANLCFTDAILMGASEQPIGPLEAFESNWKVMPPLRNADDVLALREGLLDGTIDVICTNHTPWDDELKNLEFPYAAFGMTGLETLFSVYNTLLGTDLSIPQLVQRISIAPREMLGIAIPAIKVGETADLTLFDPGADWTYSLQNLQSKSKNSPFLNKTLKGRVLGIVNGNQWVQNN
jgi:dihydroorotase